MIKSATGRRTESWCICDALRNDLALLNIKAWVAPATDVRVPEFEIIGVVMRFNQGAVTSGIPCRNVTIQALHPGRVTDATACRSSYGIRADPQITVRHVPGQQNPYGFLRIRLEFIRLRSSNCFNKSFSN